MSPLESIIHLVTDVFITDAEFLKSRDFVWKVLVVTSVSCIPLFILKYIRRRFAPPSYSKLTWFSSYAISPESPRWSYEPDVPIIWRVGCHKRQWSSMSASVWMPVIICTGCQDWLNSCAIGIQMSCLNLIYGKQLIFGMGSFNWFSCDQLMRTSI